MDRIASPLQPGMYLRRAFAHALSAIATCCLVFIATPVSAQPGITPSIENSVLLKAVAASGSITLHAPPHAEDADYDIYRKLRSDANFPGSPTASVPVSALSPLAYVDNSTSPYVLYEYKVVRTVGTTPAFGYVCTGFKVPASAWAGHADHYMGRVLVLTESGLAASIGADLTQLAADLKADGWVPIMDNSVSSMDDPDDVRDLIIAEHTNDPALKAVLLIGRIPVPLAQNNSIDPDKHADNDRLWPTDGYYGDLDGTWVKHTSGTYVGHFNMHSFPSGIEIAIGRVDLSDLPAFSATEAQLTSFYLKRAHAFRIAEEVPMERGIILDALSGYSEPLAGSGWKTLAPLVGNGSVNSSPALALPSSGIYQAWPAWGGLDLVHHLDLDETTSISQTLLLNEGSFLWSYGCGSGEVDMTGAAKVGTTGLLATTGFQLGGAFNMTFGSYLGRYYTTNNYLRAVLATGHALTSVWSGSPNWYFHNMGMGEPVARSVLQTMNNTDALYTPQDGWDVGNAPNIHTGLLGDPTLRMRMVAPPTDLVVSKEDDEVHFEWTASADVAVDGYYLYVFDADGVPSLVDPDPITGTTYSTSDPFLGGDTFMVRAVKLETTPSGSYDNLSLGAIGTIPMPVLEVTVLLGGPYDPGSGLMGDALRTLAAFPLTEPYTAMTAALDPVGGGGGETTSSGVLSTTGNNAIVDWVLVELRSTTDPSEVVEARCGLVQRDGDVVSPVDGTSPLQFSSYGDFHVAVRHRNHLGAMADDPITLSTSTPASVDFTDPGTDTYGTDAQKNESGTMVLWPGNVHADDHTVKYEDTDNDREPILTAVGVSTPTNTVPDVYAMEDVNMDDTIMYTGGDNDRDIILKVIGGSDPYNKREEQLP